MCKTVFTPENYPPLQAAGHRRRYSRHSEVRYSVICDDDHKTVTFVVIGACTKLVHDVIEWLWAKGKGLFHKAYVQTRIPLHFLNAHHRREIWVEIEPDFQKCGLEDLCLLLEAQFRSRTDCTIKKLDFSKLINQ